MPALPFEVGKRTTLGSAFGFGLDFDLGLLDSGEGVLEGERALLGATLCSLSGGATLLSRSGGTEELGTALIGVEETLAGLTALL